MMLFGLSLSEDYSNDANSASVKSQAVIFVNSIRSALLRTEIWVNVTQKLNEVTQPENVTIKRLLANLCFIDPIWSYCSIERSVDRW